MQERVRELEAQVRALTEWSDQKGRYALVSPWKGAAQVYALKREQADAEQPHYLCTNCFHTHSRVILNPISKDGYIHLICPKCKSSLFTGYRGIGGTKYAEDVAAES